MNKEIQTIYHYFPALTPEQRNQLALLPELYQEWNAKINVISRKDIDNLYMKHVLHSLGIAKVIQFRKHTTVLDVGTGGGFPGIPLAILFPEVSFHLVDSIGKKITVVNEVVKSLQLKNVTAEKTRAEELKGKYDFVVTRAVASLSEVYRWTAKLISAESRHVLKNGIFFLKGGELEREIKELKRPVIRFELKNYFEEDFFARKEIIYIS